MGQLTHEQYDLIERAVIDGTRVAIQRRGKREYIVVPIRLVTRENREVVEARNPTTGQDLSIYLDEVDRIEPIR